MSSSSDGKIPGDSPSFERMLEQLMSEVSRSDDEGAAIELALERIARFFDAESAELRGARSPMSTSDAGEHGECPPLPRLEVDMATAAGEASGSIVLHARDASAPWSEGHASSLRIAGWVLVEALRRRETEARNRRQRLWLLTALQSSEIGIWEWDVPSGRVIYVKPSDHDIEESYFRRSSTAEWFDLTHPEDVPVSRPVVDKAISGEADSFTTLVRMQRVGEAKGPWRHIYSRGRVVERDAGGRALRMVGTFEDVTDAGGSSRAEAAREDPAERAARMAWAGAVASGMAHELNQPLAALTSFLEGSARLIAREHGEAVDALKAIERSVELAHQASSVVRRFRRVLKRDAPLRESVDVGELLHSVEATLRSEAASAAVALQVEAPVKRFTVKVDRFQVEQALVNLARNGLEAAREAGRPGVVRMRARQRGGAAELRVVDNGPGIPEEQETRLFEPFSSSKGSGRGLGLVVSQSIAELHGGQVRLECTGTGGSTFLLELRVDDGDEA